MGHTNLTAKQAKFAEEYVANGGNATEAYRKVYDTKNAKTESLHRLAYGVLKNVKVASRIAELQDAILDEQIYSLKGHLMRLSALRDKAQGDNQFGAAIKAEELIGKAVGHYTQKVDLSSSDGTMTPQVSISDEQIAAWLKQRLVPND